MHEYYLNIICIDGQLGRLLFGSLTQAAAEARAKSVRFLLGPNYHCTLVEGAA